MEILQNKLVNIKIQAGSIFVLYIYKNKGGNLYVKIFS